MELVETLFFSKPEVLKVMYAIGSNGFVTGIIIESSAYFLTFSTTKRLTLVSEDQELLI